MKKDDLHINICLFYKYFRKFSHNYYCVGAIKSIQKYETNRNKVFKNIDHKKLSLVMTLYKLMIHNFRFMLL